MLIDVSLTCPLKGSESCNLTTDPPNLSVESAHAQKAGAAKKRYTQKKNKYEEVLRQYNEANNGHNTRTFSVVPFIFETTGLVHDEALQLLDCLADRCHELNIFHKENMRIYFRRALSVTLQVHIARSIRLRAAGLVYPRQQTVSARVGDAINEGCDPLLV